MNGRLPALARFAPVLLALVLAAPGALAATISGTVLDHKGQPVEFANVTVPALKRGAVTDAGGRFTLELPEGPAALVIAQIGYSAARLSVTVGAVNAPLRVTLDLEPVPVAEVNVSASSFGKAGRSEGAVVRRMDVYMTPGGAADIFQSLRALPGINAPTEGAALYVRGGDPSETVIRVDGAEIGHPYHYEGASGGLFGILDAYMLKSAFFSSGGFTAKYGGAMSGVLDIETQDPMNLRTVSVGGNFAGAGGSATWALVPDKVSALVSVNQSLLPVLFRLYGSPEDYESVPNSFNGVAKLLWRYSGSGKLSLFDIVSTDRIGVYSSALNVRGLYSSDAANHFAALTLHDAIRGKVAVRANVTTQRYADDWGYSAFGGRRSERSTQAQADFVWPVSSRHELSFGAAWRDRGAELSGHQAADSTDLGAGAPTREYAYGTRRRQPGIYAEDKLRLWGPLYATLGARVDGAARTGEWVVDPRGALAWRVDEHQTVRVAGGRYHQLPDPTRLDPRHGNPDLGDAYADHAIAGYEWKSDFGNVRLEAYHKRYRGLPITDSLTWFRAAGTGFARGLDVFAQGNWQSLNGWVSYGLLDARRRVDDDPYEVRSASSVRHSLTLVGQWQQSIRWMYGARWSYSSGRPYTPVVGATWDPGRAIWHPVYGEHGSGEMPAYNRLDLRLTRLFSLPRAGGLPPSGVCVFYAECMNVLGTKNVLEWTYDADYSHRVATESYFSRRLIVAGVSLTW